MGDPLIESLLYIPLMIQDIPVSLLSYLKRYHFGTIFKTVITDNRRQHAHILFNAIWAIWSYKVSVANQALFSFTYLSHGEPYYTHLYVFFLGISIQKDFTEILCNCVSCLS